MVDAINKPGAPSTNSSSSSSEPIEIKTIPVVEENVTIKKSTFDELMKRLERVEATADKSQLARFDAQNKGGFNKIVKLRTMNGRVVLSWTDMLTNTVERNQMNGTWKEDQRVNLKYEDGTEEEMELVMFNRRYAHITGTVIKESRDSETGDTMFDIKSDDGRVYKDINIKFIN